MLITFDTVCIQLCFKLGGVKWVQGTAGAAPELDLEPNGVPELFEAHGFSAVPLGSKLEALCRKGVQP